MAQLTERQQQVADLVKQGKKAKEIGNVLGISENAVYQQLRKIRAAGGTRSTGQTRSSNARSTASRSRSRAAAAPKPAADPIEPVVMPEDALSVRRRNIEAELKATKNRQTEADSTYKALTAECERATASLTAELERIKNAELALTGKLAPAAPKPRPSRKRPSSARKRSGSSAKGSGGSSAQGAPQASQNGNGGTTGAPAPGAATPAAA
jgi:hypothetical protein